MGSSRLPRFRRQASAVADIQITDRDREIIRLVHRNRYLRSSHILELLGDDTNHVLRRLQLLYHHGYLERPRAQLDYFNRGGSKHMIYGLGNKGATLLRKMGVLQGGVMRWGEKNRAPHRTFLEHALLVSDIMVALELACRRDGRYRLLAEDQLKLPKDVCPNGSTIRWRVKLPHGPRIGVIPDRTFALEPRDPTDETSTSYFFLEADRGTMPVKRSNLTQTSFFRKILAYQATWAQAIHTTQLGFQRFRVLAVTASQHRRAGIAEGCDQLRGGRGLFIVAELPRVEGHEQSLMDLVSPRSPSANT